MTAGLVVRPYCNPLKLTRIRRSNLTHLRRYPSGASAKCWRSSEDTVARILFAHGDQQGRQMPVVTLDNRDQVGVLRVGHAYAVDDPVGYLVATVGRVELPIDPDWRSVVDLDPAGHDDLFPIGLPPQHLAAFTAEAA